MRETYDDRGAVRIIQKTLTDSSCVYDVQLACPQDRQKLVFCCAGEREALDLADLLEDAIKLSVSYEIE